MANTYIHGSNREPASDAVGNIVGFSGGDSLTHTSSGIGYIILHSGIIGVITFVGGAVTATELYSLAAD